MAALWSAAAPMAAADVQTALADPVAYNTVQTVLTRLLAKGLVDRELRGRSHVYRPVHARSELAAEQMHQVLTRGEDQVAVLQQFVGQLSESESETLRQMLWPPPGTPGDHTT